MPASSLSYNNINSDSRMILEIMRVFVWMWLMFPGVRALCMAEPAAEHGHWRHHLTKYKKSAEKSLSAPVSIDL